MRGRSGNPWRGRRLLALAAGAGAAGLLAWLVLGAGGGPQPARARAEMAEAERRARAGDLDGAAQAWRAAARADPESPGPHLALGHAYRRRRQWRPAVECFRAAHARAPQNVETLLLLIQSLQDAGNIAEGESLARQAVALAPDNPKARVYLATHLARAAGESVRAKEAERELLAARELAPGMPIPFVELGRLFHEMGRHAEAHRTLTAGWELLHRGPRTVRQLETAAEVENRRRETAYVLGQVCRALGRPTEMRRWLERFRLLDRRSLRRVELGHRLSRDANDVTAVIELAEMDLETGSYREAAERVAPLLRQRPGEQALLVLARRIEAAHAADAGSG